MKKLPENEFWEIVKDRLVNYEEDPGDDWNAIASAFTADDSAKKWSRRIDTLSVTIVILFISSIGLQFTFPASAKTQNTNVQPAINKSVLKDLAHETSPEAAIAIHQSNQIQLAQTTSINDVKRITLDSSSSDAIETASTTADVKNDMDNEIREQTAQRDTLSTTPVDSICTSLPTGEEVISEKKKRKSGSSIYFNIAPSFSYQKIIPLANDGINIQQVNNGGMMSSNRFAITLEAGFQFRIKSNLQLYSGISYYGQHQDFSYDYSNGLVTVSPTSEQLQYSLKPQMFSKTFNYKMHNVGVSVGVLYLLHGQRLMHQMGGGLLLQQGFARSTGSYNNSSSSYVSYQMLYRLEYIVTSKIHVFGQPTFIQSIISKESLAEPLHLKPYRAGLSIGIVYNFRQ
jgi:hypothetical protein